MIIDVDAGREAGDRNAEVEAGHVPEIADVLLPERLIESKSLVVRLDDVVHRLRTRPANRNSLKHLLADRIDR